MTLQFFPPPLMVCVTDSSLVEREEGKKKHSNHFSACKFGSNEADCYVRYVCIRKNSWDWVLSYNREGVI